MKVLCVSNLYPWPAIGGYEGLCQQVATDLSARGHEVSVLTSGYGRTRESPVDPEGAVRVERRLTLLSRANSIYAPLECSETERAAIIAANSAETERMIQLITPEVVFVWSLFFLGRELLDTTRPCGSPCRMRRAPTPASSPWLA